jgi:hypothetical protein
MRCRTERLVGKARNIEYSRDLGLDGRRIRMVLEGVEGAQLAQDISSLEKCIWHPFTRLGASHSSYGYLYKTTTC